MQSVLIVLADGFEEIETVTVISILRRAKIKVIMAGLTGLDVTSSRGINMVADTLLEDELGSVVDMVVLPGGEPGCSNLQQSMMLKAYLNEKVAMGVWIGAICSAPRVLHAFGLIDGKQVTSSPTVQGLLTQSRYSEQDVVVDAPFITSRGPGTAMKFAFRLMGQFQDRKLVRQLKDSMLVS